MFLSNIFPSDMLTVAVSDETGKAPLSNASLKIENRETGKSFSGITNKSGFFQVPLSQFGSVGSVAVSATYIGRNPEIITSSGKNVITIQMQPAPKELEGVVITAPKRKQAPAPVPVPEKKKPPYLIIGAVAVILTTATILLVKGLKK